MEFFKVRPLEELLQEIRSFPTKGSEQLPLDLALGRILSEDVISQEDIPSFPRSTMDGYAVRASDTFGASAGSPAILSLKGEIRMGEETEMELGPGEAVKVPTGAMIPKGGDAVVMLEYTQQLDESTVEVETTVAPAENTMQAGEDVRKGEVAIRKGRKIRPQEMGLLAALGMHTVSVYLKPRVALLSTGDEIVDINATPAHGQIRDINRYSLHGMILQAGGEPIPLGIARDELKDLRQKSEQGLQMADILIISGGSSVGRKDYTISVIQSFTGVSILAHGVPVNPGKPTILARVENKAIFGLPGHPVSAMVIFSILVRPLIETMAGLESAPSILTSHLKARLSRNLASAGGREQYVRVRLERDGDTLWAHPVLGKSGVISTMVKADGMVRIAQHSEGLEKGAEVEVFPI